MPGSIHMVCMDKAIENFGFKFDWPASYRKHQPDFVKMVRLKNRSCLVTVACHFLSCRTDVVTSVKNFFDR